MRLCFGVDGVFYIGEGDWEFCVCLLVCLGFFNGFLKNLKNKMLLPTDT